MSDGPGSRAQGSEGVVRDYRTEDFEQVKALHEASGIDYQMPNLDGALFLVKKVVEVDGRVVACCALRIECETYLWCGGGPEEKMDAMLAMQPEVLDAAWMSGIDNVVAFIPNDVEARFEKRLRQLGWDRYRDGWHGWTRKTGADGRIEGEAA
jgi:hypothetical protein